MSTTHTDTGQPDEGATAAKDEQPEAVWGATPPPAEKSGQRWSGKKTIAVAAIAVGIATAGGVAVWASSSGDSSSSGAQMGPGGGGMPDGGGFQGGMPGGLTGALHGEYVVANTNGTYVTMAMQTGEITAISDTSVTLSSDDGYEATYVIDDNTTVNNGDGDVSDLATGDDVAVVATESGDNATATTLTDTADLPQGGGQQPPTN